MKKVLIKFIFPTPPQFCRENTQFDDIKNFYTVDFYLLPLQASKQAIDINVRKFPPKIKLELNLLDPVEPLLLTPHTLCAQDN
jgi:hypothetical protein